MTNRAGAGIIEDDRHGRLATLNEIGRVVTSALDLGGLYETIYQQVSRVMDTTQFFIALRSANPNVMEFPYNRETGKLFLDQTVQYEHSVTTYVVEKGAPLHFNTSREYEDFARSHGMPELVIGEEENSESMIFMPLNTGSRTIGAISVQSPQVWAFSEDDARMLSVIASQAAVAIENARLFRQSEETVVQMQALLHVAQNINSSLNLQTVLDSILKEMQLVIPYRLAGVLLPDFEKGELELVSAAGPHAEHRRKTVRIPFGAGVTGEAFRTKEPVLVDDVLRYRNHIGVGADVRSELAVPLRRGDAVVGVLNVERSEVGGFSQDDVSLLSLFASQAAIAIENARLYTEQQHRAEELGVIQNILQQLTPQHDVTTIARIIHEQLRRLIAYHACRIYVLDPERALLIPVAVQGPEKTGIELAVGEGVTGWIAEAGQPLLIENLVKDERSKFIQGTEEREESLIGAPLVYKGKVRGVLTLTRLGVAQFDEHALRLLEIIAAQAAIALDRARLYEELRTDAVTDELTNLYNRRYLSERYAEERARAIRNGHTLVALMVDIDKFKLVNDTYGHDSGDAVLQELAGVLRSQVRAEDIVARYGGEEFCILLPEIPLEDAMHVAERVRSKIEGQIMPPGAGIDHVTASVGMAVFEPKDVGLALFTRADQAMYAAKRAGGNHVFLSQGGQETRLGAPGA